MAAALPPEVSAALRNAGSRSLPPGPRAVLLRRLRYGYDTETQNIGGLRDGAWGSGGALATFPDLDAAAARMIEVSRILAGEHPFEAAQGVDMGAADAKGSGGVFFSLAPEHGSRPLEITHWSDLMPGDRSGDAGSPGYEVGGIDADRWSVVPPRIPRPAAYHVLLARHQAAEQLATMEGLFGPSDAAATAFQDLAAAWKALEAVPAAARLPGWKVSHADWQEFARAWKAGDNASPQCNGDCEAGLRAQLLTLHGMRDDVSAILPDWAAKLPKDLSLADAKGWLWAATDKARETINEKAPALGWFASFISGGAPRWQYGVAIAGAAVTAGAVVRSYLPRSPRSG